MSLLVPAFAALSVISGAGLSYAAGIAPLSPAFVQYVSSAPSAPQNLASAAAPQVVRPTGYMPSPVDMSHLAGKDISRFIQRRDGVSAMPPLTTYAASYDLRTPGNRLTAIRNQGSYGDCWAFATYGSMESNLLPGETWDFSENNLAMNSGFDPGPLGLMNKGGNSYMSAAYLSRWAGPVNEADDAHNGVQHTGLTVRKHMQEMLWLPEAASVNETAFKNNVKSALTTYGAVYSSIYSDDAAFASNYTYFYNKWCDQPYGSGGTCTCHGPSSSCGGHAITLVGWNDNYPAGSFPNSPPGNGAFIARNSWGAGYGESGYFYISYYDSSLGGETAVFTAPEAVTNYKTIYQYDTLGYVNAYGSDIPSTTEWMSNIFTASASEYLRAAAFYTTDTSVTYHLYIYTGVTAGSPRSGTLAYSAGGTIDMPGYHTIPLSSYVAVTSGQRFSVVVQLTNSSYEYPVPIEYPITGYSSGATASAGQSYVSPDGASWADITTTEPDLSNANVSLKAYTFTDITPPTTIGSVNDGIGADIPKTGSLTQLSANWAAASDSESGIKKYWYAIGTSQDEFHLIKSWTDNGALTSTTTSNLNLTPGVTYYFGVKAENGVGLYSAASTWSDGQVIDIALPGNVPYVNDGLAGDKDYVSSLNALSANWGAAPITVPAVSRYEYAIGTSPGDVTVKGWTSTVLALNATATGLPLVENSTYYFSVRSYNGSYSTIIASDGQRVDTTSPTARVLISSALPAKTGVVTLKLILDEVNDVAGTPVLALHPPGGSTQTITLSRLIHSTWTGSAFIESFYSTGTASFTFSATDLAGNSGSLLTAGATFTVDTIVSSTTGGSVTNSDGDAVIVPAGAYTESLLVNISTVAASRISRAESAASGSVPLLAHDITREFTARTLAGLPVSAFSAQVKITLCYPDANNDGRIDGDYIDESLARLYWLDESTSRWVQLDAHPDTAGNCISAWTSHFSVYTIRTIDAAQFGMGNLKAFPNPCYFDRAPNLLTIRGIPQDAQKPEIYIYNVAGELVRELKPGDGIDNFNEGVWDGRQKNGAKAASGLYIYLAKTANLGNGSGKFYIFW